MASLEPLEATALPASPTLGWDTESHGGVRQPNFLQKLYNFLALDPHPCPEVIYWASDSRQLVIAQPDRLVREVLPKLFKHDKLASFGRQLNIYGFSRLFPGRQFKDADGNVSDASVWAHPTLHRCSTSAEISSVKRRAAPKLFRTRRLTNGQMVRTKAGPAVEAKAREIRESIAESRRNRGSMSYSGTLGGRVDSSPSALSQARFPALQHAPPALTETGIRTPLRNSLTFADSVSRLPAITEGVVASHPPTSLFTETYGFSSRRDSAMAIDQSPTLQIDQSLSTQTGLSGPSTDTSAMMAQQSERHAVSHQVALQQNDLNGVLQQGSEQAAIPDAPPQAPPPTRPFQSCPASIHTSPVQTHMMLNSLMINSPFSDTMSASHTGMLDHVNHAQPRIAIPAAPNPFSVQDHNSHTRADLSLQYTAGSLYPLSPSSGEPSNVQTYENTPVQTQPGQLFPNSIESAFQQIQPSWSTLAGQIDTSMVTNLTQSHRMSWEAQQMPLSPPGTGTIDPRWVSPMSSAWNSLAPTRAGTPLNGAQQSAQSLERSSLAMMLTEDEADQGVGSVAPDLTGQTQDFGQSQLPHSQQLPQSQQNQHIASETYDPRLVQPPRPLVVDNASNPPPIPVLGTQSYPPRQVERRQMDISPPVPLLHPCSGSSAHKIEKEAGYFGHQQFQHSSISTNQLISPSQVGQTSGESNPIEMNSFPGHANFGIGGGKWYH